MTTPIGSIPSVPVGNIADVGKTQEVSKPTDQLADKDTFLKLLVAQLRYQDPSKPMDTQAFMAQTATFTQLEKLTDMATTQAALLQSQTYLQAAATVGQTVTYTGTDGTDATGVVTGARFGTAGAVLLIGGTEVPIGAVTQIGTAAKPSGTTDAP
ncbi:MAG: flagellar hook capping FlgD N-terminal domain-containing protein [Actinomycetales bacterium]